MSLRTKLIRLAHVNPALRPHLLPMLRQAKKDKPSKSFKEFLDEVGDDRVRNPDTGNMVKVKSLKGPKGEALLNKEFLRWQEKNKGKGEEDGGRSWMGKPVKDMSKRQLANALGDAESALDAAKMTNSDDAKDLEKAVSKYKKEQARRGKDKK